VSGGGELSPAERLALIADPDSGRSSGCLTAAAVWVVTVLALAAAVYAALFR